MTNLPYLTPLTGEVLRAAGVPEGWDFGIADKVRFYELDALNHVNNVAYLRWFETLRIPYFRDYQVSSYRADDPQLVLMTNAARYHAPLYLNDSYVVTGRTVSYRNTSFRMEYAVFTETGLKTTGESVIVCLEQDAKTKRPLPKAAISAFQSRDGAVQE
ncbi:thioesterase family protein [Aliiroseovarius subalbicans]|uniref:acyl-CoA thioesterase n=1 Tax=Aliiroseovarius subalbicans TaxID=2925840 RepID=UPI001F56784C|nr:thioesterase family protein [Aliiroseovarius subalbicans]MCI2398287.1 acyl-CoA thioesterase [Aliiroseovarius subalbicans]